MTVRGVVTGYVANDEGVEGFFLQDPVGDGDTLTSDGLYVITTDPLPEGHLIQVSGSVVEHFGLTALNDVSSWDDCGGGTTVPEVPVDLSRLPVDLEPLEGMRVRVEGPLTVVGNDKLLQFG